jgi:sRNA-binding protein
LSIEAILDIVILQTRRFARLVELQSNTMVTRDEAEEIEFLKRQSRRYVYELGKQRAAQRAAMGERAMPIVMPTANGTAPTNGNGAAPSSPAKRGKRKRNPAQLFPTKRQQKPACRVSTGRSMSAGDHLDL